MKEFKGTPGPWKIARNGFWKMGVQDKQGNWLTYKAGEDFMGQQVVEANAKLMAASPLLLKSLQALLDRLQLDGEAKNWFPKEQDDARKAIAKAIA